MDPKTDVDLTEDKGPPVLAVMWALTALTAIIVAIRLYIRACLVKNFGLDDWLVVISITVGVAYVGVTTANVAIGYGKHADALSGSQIEKAVLVNSVSFVFGILAFTIPKMAVVALLTKILNPSKLHFWFLWFMAMFTAISGTGCIFILFFMCDPPQALWKVIPGAKCLTPWILIRYSTFVGALSAFVDLYLAIYPAVVLAKLNMSLRKKLALISALGLGAIAAAMAIVKITQLKGLADKSDYTYGTVELVLWTNIEADVVLVASCIPTLQPLLERLSKRHFGSTGRSKPSFKEIGKDSSGYGSNANNSSSHPSRHQTSHDRSRNKSGLSITDVESQESILRDENQILRTDDVVVEYELEPREPSRNGRHDW